VTIEKEKSMARWLRTGIAFTLLLGGVANAGPVAPNEVCIYEHVDYVGASQCFRLEPWMRHKLVPALGTMNDKASSVLVGEEVLALLYEHPRYGGGHMLCNNSPPTDDCFSHTPGLKDKVSSLIVRPWHKSYNWKFKSWADPGGGFGVELHGDSAVAAYPLPEPLDQREARYPSLGSMNDRAHWILLRGDVEVTLYEHANFAGKSIKLPGAAGGQDKQSYDLKHYQFDERASSLVVRARGDIPVPVKPEPPPPPPRGGEGPASGSHRAPPAPVAITPKTVTAIHPGSALEMNTNRPGQDYRNFDLSTPDPKACQTACLEDMKCRAWSYIKPGIQGPKARCWLKSGIPPAEPAPCCVSGVK
jgi:hypothetical protein